MEVKVVMLVIYLYKLNLPNSPVVSLVLVFFNFVVDVILDIWKKGPDSASSQITLRFYLYARQKH